MQQAAMLCSREVDACEMETGYDGSITQLALESVAVYRNIEDPKGGGLEERVFGIFPSGKEGIYGNDTEWGIGGSVPGRAGLQ